MRLADSIRIHGIIQPLAVRRPEGGSGYELVAGERRLRAAKLLGLEQVPCVLMQADSEESAHLAIIENIQRENLNMFEQAAAIYTLMQVHCLTRRKLRLSYLVPSLMSPISCGCCGSRRKNGTKFCPHPSRSGTYVHCSA